MWTYNKTLHFTHIYIYILKFNEENNTFYIYLNMTDLGSVTLCNSNLTGHCSQKLSNSSLYPIRKYIFLALILCRTIPAMRIMLCCLLMMISLRNKACHVPVINFLINMSSTAVSAGLNPPSKLAVTEINVWLSIVVSKSMITMCNYYVIQCCKVL